MSSIASKTAIMFTSLAFFMAMTAVPAVTSAGAGPLEIKVRVTEKGFLDDKGKPYTAKHVLTIPRGTVVTVTFVFSEDLTSLAIGDTHQVAIRAEDGWKQETGPIWIMNRESSTTFRAGENGRTQYRAYCILDCIGMEHLAKLFIQVV